MNDGVDVIRSLYQAHGVSDVTLYYFYTQLFKLFRYFFNIVNTAFLESGFQIGFEFSDLISTPLRSSGLTLIFIFVMLFFRRYVLLRLMRICDFAWILQVFLKNINHGLRG